MVHVLRSLLSRVLMPLEFTLSSSRCPLVHLATGPKDEKIGKYFYDCYGRKEKLKVSASSMA
jgi:hypothetical protein